MESFHALGFCPLAEVVKKELRAINPQLTPHLCRYRGLGLYFLLVEKDGEFRVISHGGAHQRIRETLQKKYAQLTDGFFPLDVLYKRSKEGLMRDLNPT